MNGKRYTKRIAGQPQKMPVGSASISASGGLTLALRTHPPNGRRDVIDDGYAEEHSPRQSA
jgi:hypothetical protein